MKQQNENTYPMTRKVWSPCLSSRLAHASWDDPLSLEFSPRLVAAAAAAASAANGSATAARLSLEAAKKRVTGRCLIVSNDNLMLPSVFAHSAAALSLLPSPLPCSRVQLPTTGSASRKGTRAGGTPTDVHRVAATLLPPMGRSACPVLNFEINNKHVVHLIVDIKGLEKAAGFLSVVFLL